MKLALERSRGQADGRIQRGVAVYVDLENVSWLRAWHLGQILDSLERGYGPVTHVRVYTNPGLDFPVSQELAHRHLHLICVETRIYAVDEVLIAEACQQMDQLPETVAVMSGDVDFAGLIMQIYHSGRRPIVIAHPRNASSLLKLLTIKAGGEVFLLPGNMLSKWRPGTQMDSVGLNAHGRLDNQEFGAKTGRHNLSFVRYVGSKGCECAPANDEPVKGRQLEQVDSLKACQPWQRIAGDARTGMSFWPAIQKLLTSPPETPAGKEKCGLVNRKKDRAACNSRAGGAGQRPQKIQPHRKTSPKSPPAARAKHSPQPRGRTATWRP
ncbi:hypothetical protein HRbin36_00180 [bacterium HR36]|nr:hypothetical protein HRbin36_00180 [bacterium HR36]